MARGKSIIRSNPFLAVEVLAQLATCEDGRPVTTEWLATTIQRSLSYTEALMSRLRRAGFVTAKKGCGGGYALTRRPDRITVAEVFRALDDDQSTGHWLMKGPLATDRQPDDLEGTELLWASLRSYIFLFLSGVSLADIAASDGARPVAGTRVAWPRLLVPEPSTRH